MLCFSVHSDWAQGADADIHRIDFRAQEDRQSPIVEHAQSLFQPPNSTGFAAMRFLMFAFPFIV